MQPDGTLAKLGRKQAAAAPQKNGVARNRTDDGQMLDGMRRSVSAFGREAYARLFVDRYQ